MNIEERVRILEEQVRGLISARARDKMYTDADINGTRQSVANITPYTETKKAYYGEASKPFYNVPNGNISVFFSNYTGSYSVEKIGNDLNILFDTLNDQTDITISIS